MAVGIGGCVDRKAQADSAKTAQVVNDPVREVSVTPVKVQNVQQTLDLNGEISTTDDAQISAQASGKIAAVYVKEGDIVSSGQVVAMLDSENLQNQVNVSRAALAQAQAQLSQATSNATLTPRRSTAAVNQATAALSQAKVALQKALNGSRSEERIQADNNLRAAKSSLDAAKKNLDRVKKLVKEGALAESQLDSAQTQFDSAQTQFDNATQAVKLVQNSTRPEDIEAARDQVRQAEQGLETAKANKKLDVVLWDQVSAARAQVQSARSQVSVAEKNLRDSSIKSPFSGRIYGKPLQAGVVVSSGTPIARVIGGSGIYFEGQAPSDTVTSIRTGTPVSIQVDSVPGKSFPGHVVNVSPLGDSVGRLFNVRIQFDKVSDSIKPGMFANGSVVISQSNGAMMIDESSVISRDGAKYVMVAEGKVAKKVPVTTGIKKGSQIEVKGLQASSQVISRGQDALVDGSKITIESAKKGA